MLDAEKKIRAEEEAAARKRSEEAELRKALDKGSVEKKLDKFTKAREAARKKKLAGDAAAALRDVKACSDLVTVGFQSGKLSTTEALASWRARWCCLQRCCQQRRRRRNARRPS